MVGDHVRARRLNLGLAQEQFSQQLGVSESTINNWERGRYFPDLRALPRVLSWLGMIRDRKAQACRSGSQQHGVRVGCPSESLPRC